MPGAEIESQRSSESMESDPIDSNHHDFNTRDEAKLAIFDYIECFYNRNRIHQSLGYRTPDEVERLYCGA